MAANRQQYLHLIRGIKRFVQNKPNVHVGTLKTYIYWQARREVPFEGTEPPANFSDVYAELAEIARRETGVDVGAYEAPKTS